jgi:hypothetical protein
LDVFFLSPYDYKIGYFKDILTYFGASRLEAFEAFEGRCFLRKTMASNGGQASIDWEEEKKRRRAQMFGKQTHSMSMPALKTNGRSVASITAEDEGISGLRCSIISRRGDLEGNQSPPAPKKFVKAKASPETLPDFDMCSISDSADLNIQESKPAMDRESFSPIDVSKLVFEAMTKEQAAPKPAESCNKKCSAQPKTPPKCSAQPKIPGRDGKKMFSASMSSIQMKKVGCNS